MKQEQEVQSGPNVEKSGPEVSRSEKKTKTYSKRIIVVFLVGVAVLLLLLTLQAHFGTPNRSGGETEKSYRPPQPSGFAELAAGMRRERTAVISPMPAQEPTTQRIVIEGRKEPLPQPASMPPLPKYFSDKDDAQAASTLRTLKLQALTAKPVIENFKAETAEAGRNPQANSMTDSGPQPQRAQVMESAALAALMQQGQQGQADPNGQTSKQSFLRGENGGGAMTPQGYSPNVPVPQQFPYELKAGTMIPGILLTGLNSDLPGNVVGQVSENVWDTATGRYVLIPKGTRMLGVYDSQVSFGQKRVLLVWNRLVFPNGTTLDIAGSPGVDMAGYSGLSGRVNEHWGKMLGTALLASMFVAGAEIVYDSDAQGINETKSPLDVAAESTAGSILDMGTKIMNKVSDIQPTITIRPGKRIAIFVQRDIVFPSPYF